MLWSCCGHTSRKAVPLEPRKEFYVERGYLVAISGSMWQLRVQHGSYGVYVACTKKVATYTP